MLRCGRMRTHGWCQTARRSLQRRLAAQDEERDPDGRFRVNEFCCADTTWQATVVELMARAEVVLMDLRGISRERLYRGADLKAIAAGDLIDRHSLLLNKLQKTISYFFRNSIQVPEFPKRDSKALTFQLHECAG